MIHKSLAAFLLGGAGVVAFGSVPPNSDMAEVPLLDEVSTETSASTSDRRKVPRVPAGRIAFHFVGRLSFFHPTTRKTELLGYLTYLDGLPGPFFNGDRNETNAYFTIRLTSLESFRTVTRSGDTFVGVIYPGSEFELYYNESPNQQWDIPDSFSDETHIATFRESALQSSSGINWFSNDLVDSHTVRVDGMNLDFKHLVPGGVTITNVSGSGDSFAATAFAIGGKGRGRGDDDDEDDR